MCAAVLQKPPVKHNDRNDREASRAEKRSTWVALLPLAIFVGLAAVFAVQLLSGKDNTTIPSALIGKQAPQTNLPPVEGLVRDGVPVPGLNSEEFKGKLTLVNVWGSWCVPAVRSIRS